MSVPQEAAGTIEGRDDLVAFLENGCKPRADWRIGTEHEKFSFHVKDNSPLSFEGESGVAEVLREIASRFDWSPLEEEGRIIGLTAEDRGNISLEPGGQLELSGAPLENVHQTCAEVNTHLDQVRAIGRDMGVGFLGMGFSPKWALAETPRMPKGRYAIMSAYMPKVGSHGLDMMYRTCTVQVNLDFASEADMIKKLRVGLALQPVATAIFANSPFSEGKPNGFLSYRAEVWRDTDPNRTGMLPFAFEDGMGFERYVDYALDVPMYFLIRGGRYIDLAGRSFRDFFEGRLDELPGERPTRSDWANHLTTIFPEVRLKNYLEMRGADGGPWKRLCALSAFWTGLLYDDTSLDDAWDLVSDWTVEERQQMRQSVPRTALATPFRDGSVLDMAREALALSRQGLKRRTKLNAMGDDESIFLDVVAEIVDSGKSPAEQLLAKFENEWNGDIDRVFAEEAY